MAVSFDCIIKKFQKQGEKTGWTYIEIPAVVAAKMKPGNKKSFRVKGKLDNYKIEKLSLLPMGEGNFILPLKKSVRAAIHKSVGATIKVQLSEDVRQLEIDGELLSCLKDEPAAFNAFMKMPPSHQRYYSKWITDAKTDQTRIKRIARTVTGMLNNKTFAEILKSGD
jgi:hypothetical protein